MSPQDKRSLTGRTWIDLLYDVIRILRDPKTCVWVSKHRLMMVVTLTILVCLIGFWWLPSIRQYIEPCSLFSIHSFTGNDKQLQKNRCDLYHDISRTLRDPSSSNLGDSIHQIFRGHHNRMGKVRPRDKLKKLHQEELRLLRTALGKHVPSSQPDVRSAIEIGINNMDLKYQ